MASDVINVTVRDGVATVMIDNGPLNLYDEALHEQLGATLDELEARETARVCVLESARDEFFVAHYDVEAILAERAGDPRTVQGSFNALMGRFRESALVTIGKIRGAARGGGCELLLALDMRFAALGRARFSFPEAWLGILAAGGGTQRLPLVVGRARALELLLGGADLPALEAERWGLVNRALPDEDLDGFVDTLARDIASHPPLAVSFAKLAVNQASPGPPAPELEALLLDDLKRRDEARARLVAFLEAGGQTAAGEASFDRLLRTARGEHSRAGGPPR